MCVYSYVYLVGFLRLVTKQHTESQAFRVLFDCKHLFPNDYDDLNAPVSLHVHCFIRNECTSFICLFIWFGWFDFGFSYRRVPFHRSLFDSDYDLDSVSDWMANCWQSFCAMAHENTRCLTNADLLDRIPKWSAFHAIILVVKICALCLTNAMLCCLYLL